jgi:hypothetical protein
LLCGIEHLSIFQTKDGGGMGSTLDQFPELVRESSLGMLIETAGNPQRTLQDRVWTARLLYLCSRYHISPAGSPLSGDELVWLVAGIAYAQAHNADFRRLWETIKLEVF